MSDISITQVHELPPMKARAAAQKVADRMAEEYDVTSEWDGNVLLFRRAGVSGRLTLLDREVRLEIQLSFLLIAFKRKIEEQVGRNMKKVFAGIS